MLDFGALPPEINSTRMYAGPGAGPLLAAAAAWDALAAQLDLFATAYSGTLAAMLGENWSGAASAAMASAAAPYVAWASTTSAQAEETAGQVRAATAAYEGAFAATVPPAAVEANRSLLTMLVATNFLGQNAAAIAATETAYAEMWAQDAVAMYGYAAGAAAAAKLLPFDQPPQTTNAAGYSAQESAASGAVQASAAHSQGLLSQLTAALPQQLQNLASGSATNTAVAQPSAAATSTATSSSSATSTAVLSTLSTVNTLDGPLTVAYQVPYTVFSGGTFYNGLTQSKVQAKDLPKIAEEDALPPGAAKASMAVPDGVGGPVVATAGQADSIDVISVPQNWTTAMSQAAPAVEPVAAPDPAFRVLPPWTINPTPPESTTASVPVATPAAMPGVAQIPNSSGRGGGNVVYRMRDRRYRIPRPAFGG
jgi:PPE-repeat protein